MEQRPLRLGDIVDDYCPRERRITNHAVVALVDQTIRQTRCGTCDAEHEYKEAREPKRRKKDTSALFEQVLADASGARIAPRVTAPADEPAADSVVAAASPAAADSAPDGVSDVPAPEQTEPPAWTTHRTLIRASLPRTADTPPPARTIPEFTMHQRQNSRFGFRHGGGWSGNGQSRGNGNSFGNGHPHGNGQGNGHGGGHNGNGHNGRGGRHRGGGSNRPR